MLCFLLPNLEFGVSVLGSSTRLCSISTSWVLSPFFVSD